MDTVQKQVLEFHNAGGHLINDVPSYIDDKTIILRQRLITEETNELFNAMCDCDLVSIADALADLLYVVYGTAVSYGIDMEPISAEVHRSNMTKFGNPGEYQNTCDESGKSIKDAGGKTLKPSTYDPPRLVSILESQMPINNP